MSELEMVFVALELWYASAALGAGMMVGDWMKGLVK